MPDHYLCCGICAILSLCGISAFTQHAKKFDELAQERITGFSSFVLNHCNANLLRLWINVDLMICILLLLNCEFTCRYFNRIVLMIILILPYAVMLLKWGAILEQYIKVSRRERQWYDFIFDPVPLDKMVSRINSQKATIPDSKDVSVKQVNDVQALALPKDPILCMLKEKDIEIKTWKINEGD